jgi:hypothetical protein
MSKTIDILGSASAKKQASHQFNMQDEIAKTYFQAPVKKGNRKKAKWKAGLPWVIAALAVAAACIIVAFRSSVNINVRLLGEIPSMPANLTAQHPAEGLDKGVFLIESGEPNKDIVKNAYFAGDARAFSLSRPEELLLVNSRGAGWANYTLDLKEPIDLNKLDLRYTARGGRGDEFLLIVIADSNNRIYRLEKDLSSALNKDWQRYTVNFRRIKRAVDLSNISAIKFEFGSLTAGNYPSAVLSLKDVYLTKTRRLKWL